MTTLQTVHFVNTPLSSHPNFEEMNHYLDRGRNSHVRFVGGENAFEKVLRVLDAGRIDVVIDDEAVFRYTAEAMGIFSHFRLAGKDSPTDGDYVFVAFPPAIQRQPGMDASFPGASGSCARQVSWPRFLPVMV